MHVSVEQPVLVGQRLVMFLVGVQMARLVVGTFDASDTSLQRGSPTRLALVASIHTNGQHHDAELLNIGSEARPESVRGSAFVHCTRDVQEPLP